LSVLPYCKNCWPASIRYPPLSAARNACPPTRN
jgi:hypothetical protein